MAGAIVAGRACPRLVAHREETARVKRRQFCVEDYWSRQNTQTGRLTASMLAAIFERARTLVG